MGSFLMACVACVNAAGLLKNSEKKGDSFAYCV